MLTGLLGAIAFFAAIFKLPGEKSENRGKSPDMSGNILYVIFIVMMMYGLSEIGKGMIYVLITAVGVILGILFIIHESRSEGPIVNVTLFRENKGYAFSNISAMLNYGATFAISYLISNICRW